MESAIQSICDRFVLDIACLHAVAEMLPERSLERRVPATSWTVRQTFNHVALAIHEYGSMVARFLEGEPVIAAGFDRDTLNAGHVSQAGVTPLPEILASLGHARDRLFAALERLSPTQHEMPFAGEVMVAVLADWSQHGARHALELLEALPEIRFEPFFLSWLLGSELGGSEEISARRERLRTDAMAASVAAGEVSHAL